MTMTHTITSPDDLGAMFRGYSETCKRAAKSASARHQRELWEAQAATWKAAASIASACVFKPERGA